MNLIRNKKSLSLFIFLIGIFSLKAQVSFGVKGGVLYNFKGNFKEITQKGEVFEGNGSGEIGSHFSIFTRLKAPILFIQPELTLTNFSYSYLNKDDIYFKSKVLRLGLTPIMGFSFLSFFRAYIGTPFSFNLRNKIDLEDTLDFKLDRWTAGIQIGLGLDASIVNVDLRWERGFNKSQNAFSYRNSKCFIENKPSMILVSVGLKTP